MGIAELRGNLFLYRTEQFPLSVGKVRQLLPQGTFARYIVYREVRRAWHGGLVNSREEPLPNTGEYLAEFFHLSLEFLQCGEEVSAHAQDFGLLLVQFQSLSAQFTVFFGQDWFALACHATDPLIEMICRLQDDNPQLREDSASLRIPECRKKHQ